MSDNMGLVKVNMAVMTLASAPQRGFSAVAVARHQAKRRRYEGSTGWQSPLVVHPHSSTVGAQLAGLKRSAGALITRMFFSQPPVGLKDGLSEKLGSLFRMCTPMADKPVVGSLRTSRILCAVDYRREN